MTDAQGLIILYTGDGKGKTSAALGALLRAHGWQMRERMFQFIKREGLSAGEHRSAKEWGLEIVALGCGLTSRSKDLSTDRERAQAGWEICRQALADPECDVLILDEVTYPIRYGWLPLEEVLAALAGRPAHQHVILTGRGAPEGLVAAADLVTEMRTVKHPCKAGVPAQRGVEF